MVESFLSEFPLLSHLDDVLLMFLEELCVLGEDVFKLILEFLIIFCMDEVILEEDEFVHLLFCLLIFLTLRLYYLFVALDLDL